MGAGSSIPFILSKKLTESLAGEHWTAATEARFDAVATENKITRGQWKALVAELGPAPPPPPPPAVIDVAVLMADAEDVSAMFGSARQSKKKTESKQKDSEPLVAGTGRCGSVITMSGASVSGAVALEAPWKATVDAASGNTYYYNTTTNETSWDPPGGGTSSSASDEATTTTASTDAGTGDAGAGDDSNTRTDLPVPMSPHVVKAAALPDNTAANRAAARAEHRALLFPAREAPQTRYSARGAGGGPRGVGGGAGLALQHMHLPMPSTREVTSINHREAQLGDEGVAKVARLIAKQKKRVEREGSGGRAMVAAAAAAAAAGSAHSQLEGGVGVVVGGGGDVVQQFDEDGVVVPPPEPPPPRPLATINLDGNGLTWNGVQLVVSQLPAGLTTLRLSDNLLGDQGVRVLSAGLARQGGVAPTLTHLTLSLCNVGAEGAAHLSAALEKLVALDFLNLDANPTLGDGGATRLFKAVTTHPTLRVLRMNATGLGFGCCEALGEMVELNVSLVEMHLAENRGLGDLAAEALGEGLRRNFMIERVFLDDCNIGNKGAKELAMAIAKNRLRIVSLLDNPYIRKVT